MAEAKTSYSVDVNCGVFIFDSRDEDNMRLSVSGNHTFVVSCDEEEIQKALDRIVESFSSDKYNLKKGKYRYRDSTEQLNPLAVKVFHKNGIEIENGN